MKARRPRAHSTALPLLLTREDVAQELSVGVGTVDKLLKLGRDGSPDGLRSVRINSAVRIPRVELDRFISSQLDGQPLNGGAS